jgi:hypothetical protein
MSCLDGPARVARSDAAPSSPAQLACCAATPPQAASLRGTPRPRCALAAQCRHMTPAKCPSAARSAQQREMRRGSLPRPHLRLGFAVGADRRGGALGWRRAASASLGLLRQGALSSRRPSGDLCRGCRPRSALRLDEAGDEVGAAAALCRPVLASKMRHAAAACGVRLTFTRLLSALPEGAAPQLRPLCIGPAVCAWQGEDAPAGGVLPLWGSGAALGCCSRRASSAAHCRLLLLVAPGCGTAQQPRAGTPSAPSAPAPAAV